MQDVKRWMYDLSGARKCGGAVFVKEGGICWMRSGGAWALITKEDMELYGKEHCWGHIPGGLNLFTDNYVE